MFNLQSEIEQMRLRAEIHEESYKRIESEMDDILDKMLSGQGTELTKKLWKEECVKEEIRSTERWQNSNVKLTEKYETDFLSSLPTRTHSSLMKFFLHSNIKNKPASQQLEQQQNTDMNETNKCQ